MDAPRSPAFDRLLSEMREQPDVVARICQRQAAAAAEVGELLREAQAVVLVARGSSDNAAVYGRYLFETIDRALTSLAAPSTVTLYGAGPRLSSALVLGISQSGQGADVVAYVEEARRQGARTVALVNDTSSPLARAAERVLDCSAGPELSIPATKTVTAQMALLAQVALCARGVDPAGAFEEIPEAIAAALALRPQAEPLARALARQEGTSVIGRGLAYPVALELALKLKEMANADAEPFSAADFFHGPVALVGARHGALVVDVGGPTTKPALEIAETAGRRGGEALFLRAGSFEPEELSLPSLGLRAPVPDALAPILAVVLAQQLAVELALAKGLDPATPRGLTKVTSTR